MPRFAANITLMFNEVPFLDRFEKAAASGFKAVEFLFPYAYAASDIKVKLDQYDLQLVLHNLPPGDWEAGERGIACHPDRIEEFHRGVATAISYAQVMGVKQLHCMSGKLPAGVSVGQARETLLDNLRFAADEFKKSGLRLLIEPINHIDMPGYFLNYTAQAAAILADVGVDNLFIQYDIYHAQRMEGELAATLEKYLPQIAHIQLADNPGRNEPGTGEINCAYLFAHLDRLGYAGWIGCEYKPAHSTEAGLHWRDTLIKLTD